MMSSSSNSLLTSYDPQLAQNAANSPPKLVPFSMIESILLKLLSTPAGVESIFASQRRAFVQSTVQAKDAGISSSLPIQTAGQPPQPTMKAGGGAQVCIKTGYTQNGDVMVSKVAAGGGTASNTGAVFVYDQSTLRLKAVLCDEGLLTEVRTAAACAYASKFMLGEERFQQVHKIGIVGGGVQAVWQLRMLGTAMMMMMSPAGPGEPEPAPPSPSPSSNRAKVTVVVKTTSRETAEAFVQRMATSSYLPDREWEFEYYVHPKDGGEGFRGCQLIHTLTPSRAPVIGLDDVQINDNNDGAAHTRSDDNDRTFTSSFLHITAVGADSPGKMELDADLIRKADALICDSIPQSKCRGEFQSSEFWESLVEIGTMMNDDTKGNGGGGGGGSSPGTSFSIFDSSGLPLQDVEMANLISEHLDS